MAATPHPQPPIVGAIAIAIAALVAGCDSDSTGTPSQGGGAPAISLGVNPQSISVPQGGSTQISAMVTKINYSGAVTLSVTGAPASVTVSVTQPPATGAVAAGLIGLTATSATAPGTYNLTIQASGNGVAPVSTTFTLTVTAVGTYTLSANASAIALAPGSSGTVQVAITRESFPSLIDLEAVILPNGVTGTFAPNPTTGNAATLTFGVGAGVPTGSYNLSLRGSSAGSPQRSVQFVLMVGTLSTFTVSAAPTPVTVPQGASRTVALSITRGASFTAIVTLAVEGAPQGLTAVLNPALVTGTSSTLTLTAAANLAVRLYTLTIRTGSAGVPEQSLLLPVIVTQ